MFGYEAFYEFFTDVFEADTVTGAQEALVKLLEYVPISPSSLPPLRQNAPRVVFPRSTTTRAVAPRSTR